MKHLLLTLTVLLSTSLSAVEYGYLYSNKGLDQSYIFLGNNEVFEVIYASKYATLYFFDDRFDINELKTGKKFFRGDYENYIGFSHGAEDNQIILPKVAGPLYIYLNAASPRSMSSFVWYKIYNLTEL